MSDYPAHLTTTHHLFDGRTVTIRPVRRDDAARMRDFLQLLSGESRYLRFLKWVGAPGDNLVQQMTDIDYDRQMAFVCTASNDTDEEIVGEARYFAQSAGAHCEFGIVVADQWRRSGIAGVLMAMLMRVAAERGLTTMEGSVLHSNQHMLKFCRALGFEIHGVPEDLTTMRVIKKLDPGSSSQPKPHVAHASHANACR